MIREKEYIQNFYITKSICAKRRRNRLESLRDKTQNPGKLEALILSCKIEEITMLELWFEKFHIYN